MNKHPFQPYVAERYSAQEVLSRAERFHQKMKTRRSVRDFSSEPVDRKVIEEIIMSASTAPSGANKQPWTFCAISSAETKSKIREAAEEEEYKNYHGRMSESWLADLAPLETDWKKPFLETAPWLIVLFRRIYETEDGERKSNYYINESVGIAAGMLISAIHDAGMVTLTHTPSPMGFLQKVLDRPDNERAFLLLPVGYAAQDAQVPVLTKKTADEVIVWHE